MYAAETLYRAAIANRAYELSSGSREVNGVRYDWEVSGSSICVNYELHERKFEKCVDTNL